MTLWRRFFVVFLFALWQGGFLFYVTFVVPVGTEVLGSAMEQGFITRQVTQSLNLVGTIALVVLTWETLSGRSWRRWVLLLAMVAMHSALVILHPRMDALLDLESHRVEQRPTFYRMHRWYLWLSTFLWAASLVWMALTLRLWERNRSS